MSNQLVEKGYVDKHLNHLYGDSVNARSYGMGKISSQYNNVAEPWEIILDGGETQRQDKYGNNTWFFTKYGETFGAGNGTTTINVPDESANFGSGKIIIMQVCEIGFNLDGDRIEGAVDLEEMASQGVTAVYGRNLIDGKFLTRDKNHNASIHGETNPPRTLSVSTTGFKAGESIQDINGLYWYAKTDFTKAEGYPTGMPDENFSELNLEEQAKQLENLFSTVYAVNLTGNFVGGNKSIPLLIRHNSHQAQWQIDGGQGFSLAGSSGIFDQVIPTHLRPLSRTGIDLVNKTTMGDSDVVNIVIKEDGNIMFSKSETGATYIGNGFICSGYYFIK